MINFENNVIVKFNGCEVFNDKVEKNDAYIKETARIRYDPYFLFCAKIGIEHLVWYENWFIFIF